MIKRIDISELRVGMYIHDLNCDWMSHPFLRRRFMIAEDADIGKIADSGIHQVYIDTRKGLDVAHAPTAVEVKRQLESEIRELAGHHAPPPPHSETREEIGRAKRIHHEAHRIIHGMLHDVRLGKQVELASIDPAVETMTESILRNGNALLSLCRIKDKDNYTFQHSVSVGALMVSFCHAHGMSREIVHQAGIGGMLHDIGKMRVPDSILNKPGPLTEDEFGIMKCHVVESRQILLATEGITGTSIDVAAQHHERHDGSGYPQGLKGDEISELGQMAAIVDVYDALTSTRCYHQAMPPTDALRKIYEWSAFHFSPHLVQAFLRITGIYPVGSLVRLESGRLAVVVEQNEKNLVTPVVVIMYSLKGNAHLPPERLDLSRPGCQDRIVNHEDPDHWNIQTLRYLDL